MTDTPERQDTPRKPDGVFTTQIDNHTIITEIFFDHSSKDTFQDKLLKAISAEPTA